MKREEAVARIRDLFAPDVAKAILEALCQPDPRVAELEARLTRVKDILGTTLHGKIFTVESTAAMVVKDLEDSRSALDDLRARVSDIKAAQAPPRMTREGAVAKVEALRVAVVKLERALYAGSSDTITARREAQQEAGDVLISALCAPAEPQALVRAFEHGPG